MDLLSSFPPFLLFFVGALLLMSTRGVVSSAIIVVIPIISFIGLLQFDHGDYFAYQLMGMDLVLVHIDRLGLLFAYLFHLVALLVGIFALHEKDKVQQVAAMAYAGSAVGAVLAGDWISLFVFWELLALTSVFLVWARRTPSSYQSGIRYLVIQILSGVLLFAGALVLIAQTGDATFRALELGDVSSW